MSRRFVAIAVFLPWCLVLPGARALGATELPPAFRDAVAALEVEEPQRALEVLDTLDDRGDHAGRIHYARAVAFAQRGELDRAACSWSRAVQEESGLAGIDPAAYPRGEELAGWLGIDGSLPVTPEGVPPVAPVPARIEIPGPYTGEMGAATETGTLTVDGVVLPDGRFVVRRVTAEDPALARFLVAQACRWRFEPATADGMPVAVPYSLELGSAAELLAELGRPLDLETMELPDALALVRDHLLAERWKEARKAVPAEPWIRRRSAREVGLYFAFDAMTREKVGRETDAVCQWVKARYVLPEIAEARFGPLDLPGRRWTVFRVDTPERQRPREVDESVTPPIKRFAPGPDYTRSMRERWVQGAVVAQSIIDQEGRVVDIQVVETSDPEIVLPTLDAFCRWTFEPATSEGEPVAVYYELTVNFRFR